MSAFNVVLQSDDGGRRGDLIMLEQSFASPVNALSSLGSTTFEEPLTRHAAEHHAAEDKRHERRAVGCVRYAKEPNVPDVGGLGWRTRTGHLLKNQAYYSSKPKTNKWDLPCHAGTNTWKEWHGPKMRTDADMMERLDRFDEEQDHWEAKKTFVNTTRVQTLDRFYNRKVQRSQLEASSSWAPHIHGRREVHSSFETFDSGYGEKPEKELKKVFTTKVLERDREAVRQIAGRIQNEETFKMVWKQMEGERRADLRADLQHRQAHTDRLMHLSGQPLRKSRSEPGLKTVTNCSRRGHELSRPKLPTMPKDVTTGVDFRGLIHADEEHALEALFPGHGHELSVVFRNRATRSTTAGWPPPPPAETPRAQNGSKTAREDELRAKATLTKASVPASEHRLEGLGNRLNDDTFKDYSKAQFLPSQAPPPPNQKEQLLTEDWTPATTLHDASRVNGSFSRTDQSFLATHSPMRKSMEHLPTPTKPYIYPVMVPSSPKAKPPLSPMSPAAPPPPQPIGDRKTAHRNKSAPALLSKKGAGDGAAPVGVVCQELDTFEAKIPAQTNVANFFGTPKPRGGNGNASQDASCLRPRRALDDDDDDDEFG